jgi:hypothetical protein
VGCLYSIGGAGGECPSREKPLEADACVQSTGPQQSRQRSTAGERETAAFQSPIEFWHPTGWVVGTAISGGVLLAATHGDQDSLWKDMLVAIVVLAALGIATLLIGGVGAFLTRSLK